MKFGFILLFNKHTHTKVSLHICLWKVPAKMSEEMGSVNRRAAHTLTGVWPGDGWNFSLLSNFFSLTLEIPFSLVCGGFYASDQSFFTLET